LSKEYVDKLLKDNEIVVLDFYATWCGPCIKMMPTIDKLKSEMEGKVIFEKIDSDANKALVTEYKIDEIPTFLIYKNGKLAMRAVGFQTEQGFREMIGE
jgi:thioredoxin